jgi:hypothetical protein
MSDRASSTDDLSRMLSTVMTDLPAEPSPAASSDRSGGGGTVRNQDQNWLSPQGSVSADRTSSGTFLRPGVASLFVDTSVGNNSPGISNPNYTVSGRSGTTADSSTYISTFEAQTSQSGFQTSSSSSGTGYSVFIFPDDSFACTDLCCHKIGHGETVCVKLHCDTQHRGEKISFPPGTIAVNKTKGVIFVEPTTSKTFIQNDVIEQWKESDFKRPLDTWKELFSVINGIELGKQVSYKELESARDFINLAKEYRSPKGHSTVDFSAPALINMLNVDQTEIEEKTFGDIMLIDPSDMIAKRKLDTDISIYERSRKRITIDIQTNADETIHQLQEDITVCDARLNAVASKLDGKELFFNNEVKVLLSKVDLIESTVGNRIMTGPHAAQSPTLWGSIASLATSIDDCMARQSSIPKEFERDLSDQARELKTYIEESVREMQSELLLKIANISTRVQDISESIRSTEHHIMGLARGSVKLKDDMRIVNQLILDRKSDNSVRQSSLGNAQFGNIQNSTS